MILESFQRFSASCKTISLTGNSQHFFSLSPTFIRRNIDWKGPSLFRHLSGTTLINSTLKSCFISSGQLTTVHQRFSIGIPRVAARVPLKETKIALDEIHNHSSMRLSQYRHLNQRRSQGAVKGFKPPLSNENIDAHFVVFHQHCKSRSGALHNVFRQYHKA